MLTLAELSPTRGIGGRAPLGAVVVVVGSPVRRSAGGSANTVTLGTLAVAISVPAGAGTVVVVDSTVVSGAASSTVFPEHARGSGDQRHQQREERDQPERA